MKELELIKRKAVQIFSEEELDEKIKKKQIGVTAPIPVITTLLFISEKSFLSLTSPYHHPLKVPDR